ncbi:NAD(P)-dependent oxidoreductase [Vulcanococcus limneticus]|uniref:NAD(P)-dependent oxidoreductase n=1 Tax=Vulcanococcus limneticus TaxID=2170428 RepID=UPI00398C0B1E
MPQPTHGHPPLATSPSLPSVAWIGLGALGSPMASNLLAAGFPLTVHNRRRGREEPLAARGARRAASPAEAAAGAELIAVCVSDDAAVEAVLFGGPGVVAGARRGSLVIDCSTIAPATSRRLAQRLEEQGIGYLDAPVTGGTEGARAGTLSVLVGGSPGDLERARPLLGCVGSRLSHFGPVGAGQAAKAVNQVLVAGSYAAVAEGLALARRLELPLEPLVEALKGGAAGSWALEHRSGAMIAGSFPLGFRLALHRKDLAIALAEAAAAGLELPVSERVAALEDCLLAAGWGDEDVAALARWFEGGARGPDGEGPGGLRG